MFDKNIVRFLALVVLAGVVMQGQAQTATNAEAKPVDKVAALFGDEVVAKGKGVEVKRGQLDEEVIRIKSQLAAAGQPIPAAQVKMVEQNILDQMIALQLLKGKATDEDKASAK